MSTPAGTSSGRTPDGAGGDADEVFDVVVETPRGSRNKYEHDPVAGRIRLDRRLFSATVFPADYGFVPGTLAPDGDPLDALVLLEEPTFPGCLVRVRAVGVHHGSDEAGDEDKLVCVPVQDPEWVGVVDLEQLRPSLLKEIEHFFAIYKELEPGRTTRFSGWGDRRQAERSLRSCRSRFETGPSEGTSGQ